MRAVGADGGGKIVVRRYDEKHAATAADRGIAMRRRDPARMVIVAKDDGGAGGKRAQDRLRARRASTIGEKGERKGSVPSARAFEPVSGRC